MSNKNVFEYHLFDKRLPADLSRIKVVKIGWPDWFFVSEDNRRSFTFTLTKTVKVIYPEYVVELASTPWSE